MDPLTVSAVQKLHKNLGCSRGVSACSNSILFGNQGKCSPSHGQHKVRNPARLNLRNINAVQFSRSLRTPFKMRWKIEKCNSTEATHYYAKTLLRTKENMKQRGKEEKL